MTATTPARSLPIKIEALTKVYGSAHALAGVSLDIMAGEFLTLLGPSGSGKTTLLMALAGFVHPDSGRIRFGETEVTLLPPHKRNVGMVFQNYALFPHMTVLENVKYPLKLRGIKGSEAEQRAERALGLVQLDGFGNRRIDQLSGGQQQRVALARAIVFEPPVLLMDEPLSALDKKLREAMQVEIRRLHERVGATTVYVTHDQHEALAMSDRVAVLSQGRLQQVGPPEEIYQHPANLFVADFIGDSHVFPVQRENGRILLGSRPLNPPGSIPDGPLMLVVRPEKLNLLNGPSSSDMNELDGLVSRKVFVGDAVIVFVTLANGPELTVKVQTRHGLTDTLPDPGQPIRLGLHQADTILLPAER
ncbi:ABC transporter ATP-binding protein [Rhodoligotrophos defluvii]|uniref:ABC transporter ATP-binding protein n=1 Tax=Rhodoligotrophos defluvii TaxID=2561934 RepID=UPI0010C93F5D|nr:ABC transporter ATP-binding protein [Rhodoligotrophos defluvii]